MLDVAKMLYGDETGDEMELVLPTLQMFSANFWRTLGMRFAGNTDCIDLQESRFIIGKQLPKELEQLNPKISVLFKSDKGKFFLASDSLFSLL